jgi:hypothetical protein
MYNEINGVKLSKVASDDFLLFSLNVGEHTNFIAVQYGTVIFCITGAFFFLPQAIYD